MCHRTLSVAASQRIWRPRIFFIPFSTSPSHVCPTPLFRTTPTPMAISYRNHTFFRTVHAALERFDRFMIVGRRCNVDWQPRYRIQDFDELLEKRENYSMTWHKTTLW